VSDEDEAPAPSGAPHRAPGAPPTASAAGRLFRLGGLAARVGMSLATEQALSFLRSDPIQQARKSQNFMLNAIRVTEALGSLKGAAMKAGQMLSVHDGLLPPEVAEVLRGLQQSAPPVPRAAMSAVLDAELPERDEIFESLEDEPIASASIGQVYRGRLRDGRVVAVKVQYPDIDRIVRSDLKNLKKLFGALVAMLVDVDFEPIWVELKDRLLEELDYTREAANMERMRRLHDPIPEVLVPAVIPEASSTRVLTMEYLAGLSPDDVCPVRGAAGGGEDRYGPELRNRWGRVLFEFVCRGLLEHRFLHADPNFANYAFREDGRLIVYDHGCMKEIPPAIAHNCRRGLEVILEADLAALPGVLKDLGVYHRRSGEALTPSLLAPFFEQAVRIAGPAPFRFTPDSEVYRVLFEMKSEYFSDLTDVVVPPDMVFVNRALSGLFGNLCRLEAEDRWRDMLARYAG
jgi:predicted unusual protein kinase regulating ubiquinone biosynthesis (AarF/ABC1/UbiB family)